jgi:DNA-binding NarL/FixJ family response regulator
VAQTAIRVVIVDDHPLVREGTLALLRDEPDVVVAGVAGDAATAVRLLEEQQPDVLLLDIRLPDATGVDVARRAASLRPETAILILTGYDDVAYARALLQLGVRGYLRKTASGQDIVAAIRALAAGQIVLGSDIVSATHGADTDPLTEREIEVLRLLATGRRNTEVAAELGVSIKTIEFHVGNLLGKLGARSRTEAIVLARQIGYLEP